MSSENLACSSEELRDGLNSEKGGLCCPLETQIPRPHPKPTDSETLGMGHSNLCVNNPFTGFWNWELLTWTDIKQEEPAWVRMEKALYRQKYNTTKTLAHRIKLAAIDTYLDVDINHFRNGCVWTKSYPNRTWRLFMCKQIWIRLL